MQCSTCSPTNNIIATSNAGDTISNSIILHIDLDCFFVQVERLAHPSYEEQPIAIQQHQDIICVSYEARKLGVKKHDLPAHIKTNYPQVTLVHVAKEDGTSKVSYKKYSDVSDEFFKILRRYSTKVEKASIDEAFIDVTEYISNQLFNQQLQNSGTGTSQIEQDAVSNTNNDTVACSLMWEGVVFDSVPKILSQYDKLLLMGASLCKKIRTEIFEELKLTCSGGIASNKLLAKLASSMNKPFGQTSIPIRSINRFLQSLPLSKLPKIKNKINDNVILKLKQLKVSTIADLQRLTKEQLKSFFSPYDQFVYNSCRGIDNGAVVTKGPSNTISASMSLVPINNNEPKLRRIIYFICKDLKKKLTKDALVNNRHPQQFEQRYRLVNEKEVKAATVTVYNLKDADSDYDLDKMTNLFASKFISSVGERQWKLRWIAIIAKKFLSATFHKNSIASYFTSGPTFTATTQKNNNTNNDNTANNDSIINSNNICSNSHDVRSFYQHDVEKATQLSIEEAEGVIPTHAYMLHKQLSNNQSKTNNAQNSNSNSNKTNKKSKITSSTKRKNNAIKSSNTSSNNNTLLNYFQVKRKKL